MPRGLFCLDRYSAGPCLCSRLQAYIGSHCMSEPHSPHCELQPQKVKRKQHVVSVEVLVNL